MSNNMTCEAGSSTLLTTDEETKRHSRSLDLGNSNARMSVRHLHQRSASESDGLVMMKEVVAVEQQTEEKQQQIPTSSGIFSLYKKLGRKASLRMENNKRSQFSRSRASIGSAFSNFRQPSLASINSSSKRSNRAHTPGKKDAFIYIYMYLLT
jgi:hypothetical protein